MGFPRGAAGQGYKGSGGQRAAMQGYRRSEVSGYGGRRAHELPDLNRGFAFVDGVYLAPPYQLQVRGDELRINDVVIPSENLDLSKGFEPEEGTWGNRGRQIRPVDQLCDAAHGTLALDGVLVIAKGMTPVLADRSGAAYEILVALAGQRGMSTASFSETRAPKNDALVELQSDSMALAFGSDGETLEHLFAHFRGSPEFNERAERQIALVRHADQSGDRIVKASLWADSIGYPLTLFAMMVVVVAFGHLLSNKPCLDGVGEEGHVSPETKAVVIKSLLLFGLLSVVDLVWTIAAASTGSMREMNPLGEGMIADPIQLTLFKVTAVGTTIGLLYVLHHRPIAQVASWWSCLVLTLLTARWLTFNSMFM